MLSNFDLSYPTTSSQSPNAFVFTMALARAPDAERIGSLSIQWIFLSRLTRIYFPGQIWGFVDLFGIKGFVKYPSNSLLFWGVIQKNGILSIPKFIFPGQVW